MQREREGGREGGRESKVLQRRSFVTLTLNQEKAKLQLKH